MSKKILRSSTLAIVIMLLIVTTVFAGSTTKTLSTNFTLVNFGSEEALVNVDYLLEGGADWDADDANESFTIPANGQRQIRQYFDTTMVSGKGSAAISSTQPLGAVVQVLARNQTPSSGAYKGYSGGNSKWYIPLAAHMGSSASGLVNSQIIVQNVGTSVVNFTIELVSLDGTITYTKSVSNLGPNVMYHYDLADETNLPSNWFGSAVVSTTSGSLAVVSNIFLGSDALQTINAFSDDLLTDEWKVASFFSKLGNGLNSVVTVQNLSGGSIAAGQISLNCVKDPNSPDPVSFIVTNPAQVLNKAAYNFNAFTGGAPYPTGWYGSCTVTAPGSVVAFVQNRYINVASNQGAAAYEAIPAGGADTTMFVPLIAKRLANGFASVVTIQNQSNLPGLVTLTYIPSQLECPISVCDRNSDGILTVADNIVVVNLDLAANSSIMRNHRLASGDNYEPIMKDGWVGSLKVEADVPINGFVQLTNFLYTAGDTFMTHGIFTQP